MESKNASGKKRGRLNEKSGGRDGGNVLTGIVWDGDNGESRRRVAATSRSEELESKEGHKSAKGV